MCSFLRNYLFYYYCRSCSLIGAWFTPSDVCCSCLSCMPLPLFDCWCFDVLGVLFSCFWFSQYFQSSILLNSVCIITVVHFMLPFHILIGMPSISVTLIFLNQVMDSFYCQYVRVSIFSFHYHNLVLPHLCLGVFSYPETCSCNCNCFSTLLNIYPSLVTKGAFCVLIVKFHSTISAFCRSSSHCFFLLFNCLFTL